MAIIPSTDLAAFVRQECGENVSLCYQCQRCSSGCPTAAAMSLTPAQMMRVAQLGLEQRLVSDASIWRCLGCDSCTEHCPYGVSVRRLVETLRQRTMQGYYLAGKPETFAGDEHLAVGIRAMGMLGQRVQSQHNVSGEDNASRLAWTSNLPTQAEGLDGSSGGRDPLLCGLCLGHVPHELWHPAELCGNPARSGSQFHHAGRPGVVLRLSPAHGRPTGASPGSDGPQPGAGARCSGWWRYIPGGYLPFLLPHVGACLSRAVGEELGIRLVTASEMMRDLLAKETAQAAAARAHRRGHLSRSL